mgnify:CR=1 FL=1
MNLYCYDCSECDRHDSCQTDNKALNAATRIVCLSFSHETREALEGDANLVANAFLKMTQKQNRRVE